MRDQITPESEKMDISETSDTSVNEQCDSKDVLRLNKPIHTERLDNESVDNTQYENIIYSKNHSVTKNATNSHPLMYSPLSPISSGFPDLIPEKPKRAPYQYYEKHSFKPEAHSSAINYAATESDGYQYAFEETTNFDLPLLDEYTEKLPEFPASPSALKKALVYDMPLELCHAELSDTENEKSIYEAHLSSNLQNVSLIMTEKEGNLNFLAHGKRSNKLRRIKVEAETHHDSDISSLDSNSDSLRSEDVFAGNPNPLDEEDLDVTNERNESPEPIEPLSAAEERRHARHWQRMVLPGGEQRTIDMRVIEPYKRVLSHGGYLRAGGHTAIVVFSACFLPDKSRIDYDYVMDNLFLYVLWTLERLVTEDYVLIYLHGAATRLPSFTWLKRCYQMVGRKLRKNLTHLYIVHPTLWIKTMLFMAKPFISSKFYRKITFVGSLKELKARVPLECAAVPEKVKAYDSLHCRT
ncbi:CRAL-TRIO domain containing protein [Oryctes borbonicus]|uniref:CRAL-TRIO domain containing protein n=1 Tax=Oryctes borbonicus TaxID=1629725 RepID=A0A0T6BHY1_9SCAR|nr:CRAL-TRIO domain containing protein [Oryctes borbonicus]